MELETSLVIILCVTIVSLVGSKAAVKWRQSAILEPRIVEKRIRMQEDLIDEITADRNKWRNKYNQSKQLLKPEVENVDSLAGPEGNPQALEAYFEPIVNQLPADIARELRAHKTEVLEFVSKNPDVLKRFIKSPGTQEQSQTGGIPQFDARNAV